MQNLLDAFEQAVVEVKADEMRRIGALLLAAVHGLGVPAEAVAGAVEASGVSAKPRMAAARAALLRALLPDDARILALLRSDEAEKRRVALLEAARYGFHRMGLEEVVLAEFVQSPERPRRSLFVDAALVDGTRWSDDRLADLLADADEGVRAEAFGRLVQRIPVDRRPELAFDPKAPEADRASAQERIRAFLASRPKLPD